MSIFQYLKNCNILGIIIYNEINEIINHDKPALYVPLAMEEDKHPYDGCYEWIKSEIASIDVPFIKMVRSFEELSLLNYSDYSFIFINATDVTKHIPSTQYKNNETISLI